MNIVIGKSGGHNVGINLDVLLRTRLLIQANSGGGKSYLLRRLAEQLFGHIPVIIIDPEGEFATLREQFGYVLVGKGGETPADPRSAALVAHKLLELRASAVCDLYEMKPTERHHWVSVFIDALTNAPKNLWRPTVIIVDEVHTFCPQKGSGESEAREAMVGSATRWRKRRFCPIWATQRLAKVDKDASAEMLNRLIGPTFEDVDLKRAADLLSVPSEDKRKFDEQMRTLEPGNFFALGRAICKERMMVKIGPVETSHEIQDSKYGSEPPPPPEKIRELLPKLADLPKQAEEKAKTEAELRSEIRSLKAQLRTRPAETKEVPVVDQKAVDKAVQSATAVYQKSFNEFVKAGTRKLKLAKEIVKLASEIAGEPIPELPPVTKLPAAEISVKEVSVARPSRTTATPKLSPRPEPVLNGDLTGPEQRILHAMGELLSIDKTTPPREMVAAWAAYSPEGGAFANPLGALRSKGYIDYPSGGLVALTEAGKDLVGGVEPPDADELRRRIDKICSGPERKILWALLEHGAEPVERDQLAELSGYSPEGGAFANPLGALRTKGLLDYPRSGMVQPTEWLAEILL